MTLIATSKTAIVYDENNNFIGRRCIYEQRGNNESFIYLNGWAESVRFLIERKGYTIAIEG